MPPPGPPPRYLPWWVPCPLPPRYLPFLLASLLFLFLIILVLLLFAILLLLARIRDLAPVQALAHF